MGNYLHLYENKLQQSYPFSSEYGKINTFLRIPAADHIVQQVHINFQGVFFILE